MGRTCAECDYYKDDDHYSRNQWLKGPGYSRCFDCVGYPCTECQRLFRNANELKMHMQVHRPRNFSCPICNVTKFRSGANVVQHVESGFCSCCPGGPEEAREQVFKFAAKKKQMRRYMTEVPRITYGDWTDSEVPDFPYYCPECCKYFRKLGQLMQHQEGKHGVNMRPLLH